MAHSLVLSVLKMTRTVPGGIANFSRALAAHMRSSPLRCSEMQLVITAGLGDVHTSDIGVVWDLHNQHRACMQQGAIAQVRACAPDTCMASSGLLHARTIQRLQIEKLHPLPCSEGLLRAVHGLMCSVADAHGTCSSARAGQRCAHIHEMAGRVHMRGGVHGEFLQL